MRARIVFFGALMLVGACRTHRAPTRTAPLALTPAEQDTAAALAHFALGSFFEQDRGANSPDTIREFELASDYDPGRHRIHSKIAVGYLMRRQPSKAIAALEESCRHNPGELEPLVDLAVTCQIAGKVDKALTNIEKAIEIAPTESALYATAAKLHIHNKADEAAIAVLRRGLEIAPHADLLQLVSTRGRQLVGQQDLAGALRYFLLLRDTDDDSVTPALLNLIGQIYLEIKQPERAATVFHEAGQRSQPPAETFTKLGATQIFLGRTEEAVASLEKGRAIHPQNTRVLFSLALAYSAAERPLDAYQTLAAIKAMTARNPSQKLSMEFYITFGAAADRVGRSLVAEEAFEECVGLYPGSDQALNYLAYLWAESNQNLEQAMAYVVRALAIRPKSPAYIDTLAWVHYRNGDYASARDELKKALEVMPDDPIINEHMGDVYDALDAPDEARHYWTQSVMQDPDNQSAAWKLEATGVDVDAIRRRARKLRRKKDQD
ncbi:MAG: tetratricopeptide repeat protein [Kiritimatiellia bacterium]|jgi:tetratricopeptide (TPR) repeat protein|nr:tetratricopeptide repeat protein [Kiritimatiellia bacterium]MDP6630213.1 tetratricopeptide repeat protein [Kiritimatiellia bacterium]MDP6810699.1 tetratricopeptide repeat protein [Kiritimatiellia bacterium]MDP7023314.1 tetratricopeptide repeat protein [Kiritimatiellia bacterium]